MEYLNLYDREGNLLSEKGVRGDITGNLVGIVIIFIENSKGEFLIQKTSSSRKSIFATTGGHVSYGSTFEMTIQEDEVEYVKWMDKETINKLIKNKEFREGNIEGYQYIINAYK